MELNKIVLDLFALLWIEGEEELAIALINECTDKLYDLTPMFSSACVVL